MKQLIVTPIVLVKLNVTSILMKQLIVISNLFVVQIGGGNPGTPAYVGMIGIILRRQKNTSRYLGITPLLVKLAYCLPPKTIWYDT
jgi:hypothetical protein